MKTLKGRTLTFKFRWRTWVIFGNGIKVNFCFSSSLYFVTLLSPAFLALLDVCAQNQARKGRKWMPARYSCSSLSVGIGDVKSASPPTKLSWRLQICALSWCHQRPVVVIPKAVMVWDRVFSFWTYWCGERGRKFRKSLDRGDSAGSFTLCCFSGVAFLLLLVFEVVFELSILLKVIGNKKGSASSSLPRIRYSQQHS